MSRGDVVLAHHYHRVDMDLTWTMASRDVPELAERLRNRQFGRSACAAF